MALYFCVRIGVRGGATRLGSQLVPRREQTQIHPYLFLLAEGGVGEAALNIERMGLGFALGEGRTQTRGALGTTTNPNAYAEV